MRVYAKTFASRTHLDLLRLDQSLTKPIKKLSETGLVKHQAASLRPFQVAVMQGQEMTLMLTGRPHARDICITASRAYDGNAGLH